MLARLVETSWLNANKSDAYIIYLGTNDVKDKEVVTGSTADVNLTTPASTVTTTDIGAYGKIIQMIREQVPKAKIFIVSMCYFRNSSSQVTASNVKYQALAEYMDCYYIDLATYAAPTTAEKTAWKAANMTGGHYNTLGYKCFATWIMSYIDWIIRNNQPDFALTAFTRETYDYVTVSFTVQPQSVTVAAGSITETLTAEAEASNGAAMSYQWYSNTTNATGGTAISGATSASYTIPTSLSAGSYFYYCVASCTANSRTSAVATVTVSDSGGGSAEPTAIASYALSGTSGEAVPTIADSTGNGNSLVPAGSLTYGTGGYPYISSAGKMLSLASVNLNGATSYKLHFKFVAAADMPNNTRLFTLSDGTEASYMSISYAGTATGTSVLFEKGGAAVFANTQECQLLGILRRQTLRTFTVDVTVANDNVTIYASGTNSDGVSAEYTQSVGTISGFTAAVEGGLVIGNRSAGDRFITAELTEFSVMTAE